VVGGAELQWEASIGGRVELPAMEACGGRAEQQAVDACSRRIPGPRAGSRRPPLFPLSSLSSSIDWSCKGACPLLSFPASLFPLSIRTAGALRAGVYAVAHDFPPARNPSSFPRARFPARPQPLSLPARAIPLCPCARRSPTPFFSALIAFRSCGVRANTLATPSCARRRHRLEGHVGQDAPIGSSLGHLGVA